MKYIYVILLLLVLFVLIYSITEDRCNVEKFTQIDDPNYICDDVNANNTYTGDTTDKLVNNSYCTYNYDIICNRPFADNYDEVASTIPSSDVSVCGDISFNSTGNYIDAYVYEKDDNGNFVLDSSDNKIKVKLLKSEISGNPLKYFDRDVVVDSNQDLRYSDGTLVYKQTHKIDNSKCKYINNKICRFPMAEAKVNSLHGITTNEDEFKSLVNDAGELMPNNMLTQGVLYNDETKLKRQNKKRLFTELFFSPTEVLGEGLNIWDEHGFVNMTLLDKNDNFLITNKIITDTNGNELSTEILNSFIDSFDNIINRRSYNLGNVPGTYYKLVKLARDKGLHVALAVSKNADKYACGIATTKAIACDIALARCKTFISLEKYDTLFNRQKGNLISELVRRQSIYPIKNTAYTVVDSEVNIKEEDKYYMYRYYDDNQKQNHLTVLQSSLNDENLDTLADKYYRSLTLKEIHNIFKNSSITQDEINSVEGISTAVAGLDSVMKYVVHKSNESEESNKCGILLIDYERYENYNNDGTNVIEHCNLSNADGGCDLSNVQNICDGKENCQEAAVLGLNKDNKCILLQDFKLILPGWDKYDLLPEMNENDDQWVNEKNEIVKNNKVDLANDLLKKCEMLGSECVMYKINGETYSYNTLFS